MRNVSSISPEEIPNMHQTNRAEPEEAIVLAEALYNSRSKWLVNGASQAERYEAPYVASPLMNLRKETAISPH